MDKIKLLLQAIFLSAAGYLLLLTFLTLGYTG
jgi:hypothetical protein